MLLLCVDPMSQRHLRGKRTLLYSRKCSSPYVFLRGPRVQSWSGASSRGAIRQAQNPAEGLRSSGSTRDGDVPRRVHGGSEGLVVHVNTYLYSGIWESVSQRPLGHLPVCSCVRGSTRAHHPIVCLLQYSRRGLQVGSTPWLSTQGEPLGCFNRMRLDGLTGILT